MPFKIFFALFCLWSHCVNGKKDFIINDYLFSNSSYFVYNRSRFTMVNNFLMSSMHLTEPDSQNKSIVYLRILCNALYYVGKIYVVTVVTVVFPYRYV